MRYNHILQVASTGLSAVVGVNRAHHVVDPTGRGVTIILPVNDWIMPEGNTLSILLSRPEPPAPASPSDPPPLTSSEPPEIDVHLFLSDPASRQNDALITIARFRWPLPPPAPVASPLPFFADIPFKSADPPATTLWREAAKIEKLENADRMEIVSLVERFRAAIDRRDLDAAYTLSEYRFRDGARADNVDPGQQEAMVRSLFADMFTDTDLRAEPLTLLNATFSIVGGDRVVLVSRGLGRDTLRFIAGEPGSRRAYGFKIYVARINGRWTIVR